ncbi:pentatricopeptide repeat-containing protein At4g19220, mitochondrial isoform X2 [Ananas comosus]|uniref:Pentatricopeptide repeat-containing protein At4g19220, mitochondrial isoform X2 n=1 Tax=Ananas comosus TaxID=4615 RepID=A0A6P5ER47_ANACO|nr:pentatricopeptide repeat-containing protein At4g19220, mitochondrial isoform X2 [Ananas comosus]
MLITIRRFNRKLIRLPKYLIPITTYSNPHLFSKSPNSKPLPHVSIRPSSVPACYPFDEMPYRADFVIHALNLFKHSIVYPNTVAALHCLSLKTNSISELSVRTAVLTAYARACDVDSSLCLFDENFARDLISWNAIINACVLNRDFRTSMVLFREMLEEFGAFDSTTLVTVLSAVSRDRNLKLGKILHGTIVKRCFDMDCFLCNALVDIYAKSGDLDSSELVFERIQSKDAASWNSMIRGSLLNKLPERSVFYFREMNRSITRADEVSLSCIISACASSKELFAFGKSIHEAAEQVFIAVSYKNVVSWNAMINGLVGNGRVDEAIYIFKEMQSTGANQPDVATLVTIIPACGEFKLLLQGRSIHGYTIRRELYRSDSSIGNSLLNMYFECCDPASADILFDAMPNRDLISWNTMISGYARNDSLRDKARVIFRELLRTRLDCSLITLLAILPSCSCTQDLTFGKAIHCLTIKYGFESRVLAINALVHMYINCDDLRASFLLLKSNISMSDIVSWNTIIVGCVQSERYKDAIEAFVFMHSSLLLNPDPITLVSTIAACGHLNLLYLVKSMHGFALKHLMVSDVKVRNALITSYSRCEDISSADSVFCMGGDKNLCSWNCMISGLVQNEEGDKALELYRQLEDFEPNEISIVGIICACSQLGDLRHGMEINGHVFRFELQKNVYISAALVDMYSKCGRLDIAVRVFENSAERSTASWNSMISAYGLHGNGRKAIELFWEMVHLGIEATKSTFIALLSACSHSGLIDEGWKYYNLMSEKFGIKPTCEHNVCVVDMLGRAGRIEEAHEFVNKLCIKPEDGVWGALLSACEDYSNLEMGRSISKHLFSLEPKNTGYYVTLSNLYAHHGMWMDSVEIRSNIKDRGLVKPPACSVIDVYSNV